MNETRYAAFIEYIIRPMSEDIRLIMEKLVELKLPITPDLIKGTAIALGLWHLCGEIIRACSYIAVTWIICEAVKVVWLHL